MNYFLLVFYSIFVILSAFMEECNAKGVVYFKLIHYYNEFGLDAQRTRCDPYDLCDLKFNLCFSFWPVHPGQPCNVLLYETTDPYYNRNQLTFGSNVGFRSNPIPVRFDGKTPPKIILNINVYDDDGSYTEKHLVDTFQKGVDPQVFTNNQFHGNWTQESMELYGEHVKSKFTIAVIAVCGQNLYGQECNIHCAPTEQYYCHQVTGERICKEGWRGNACILRDVCLLDNPCTGFSSCNYTSQTSSNYSCICLPGYLGENCTKPDETTTVKNRLQTTVHPTTDIQFAAIGRTTPLKSSGQFSNTQLAVYIFSGAAVLVLIGAAIVLALNVRVQRKSFKTAQMMDRMIPAPPTVPYRPTPPLPVDTHNAYASGITDHYEQIDTPDSVYENPTPRQSRTADNDIFSNLNYGSV